MPVVIHFTLNLEIVVQFNFICFIGKPVVTTAMIKREEITKPEISDIANAIIDGSDALLLPSTTFSTRTLQDIDIICKEAEAAVYQKVKFTEIKDSLRLPMEPIYSLAISVLETALKTNAAAIICLTSSGRTARVLAR